MCVGGGGEAPMFLLYILAPWCMTKYNTMPAACHVLGLMLTTAQLTVLLPETPIY